MSSVRAQNKTCVCLKSPCIWEEKAVWVTEIQLRVLEQWPGCVAIEASPLGSLCEDGIPHMLCIPKAGIQEGHHVAYRQKAFTWSGKSLLWEIQCQVYRQSFWLLTPWLFWGVWNLIALLLGQHFPAVATYGFPKARGVDRVRDGDLFNFFSCQDGLLVNRCHQRWPHSQLQDFSVTTVPKLGMDGGNLWERVI